MDNKPNDQHPPIQWPVNDGSDKAADVARSKVDQAFSQTRPSHHSSQPRKAESLEQYHSAWQNYYKEYFKRYYSLAYSQTKKDQPSAIVTGGDQADEPSKKSESARKKAARELKQKIRQQAEVRAAKIKKSHHFKPLVAAFTVGFVFLLVNYNQVVFGAVKQYLSPSIAANTPIIITPGSGNNVGQDPEIIIPKIGVQAPVVYTEPSYDENKVENALENGVLHYGTTALPGQNGNVVVLGHSSNNVFTPGNYKYVFVNLDRLSVGDTIYLNYQGKRYTYKVTVANKVVPPTDVSVLNPTGQPIVTLITCTPAGTNLNRLVVQAVQIDPSPSSDSAPANQQQSAPQSLPATSRGIIGSFF